MVKIDLYNTYARAFPVYITMAPIVMILIAVLPEGFDWKLGGTASIVLLPLSYLCGQIGGDLGKKRESVLWQKWGGPPTTRFLRHSNCELNPITRNEIHNKLRALRLHVPSQEEQEQNPTEADIYYEACTKRLIGQTRDNERFPLVFKGLKEYGFRRNLLGLKLVGILLNILSLIASLKMVWVNWDRANPPVLAIIAGILSIGFLINWFFWITEKSVKLTDDRYARFLLEATLHLEVEDGNDSLS